MRLPPLLPLVLSIACRREPDPRSPSAEMDTDTDTDSDTDADSDADTDTGPVETLDCEVAIVGGGAGGLHTAFRLAPELGRGACLFEKEATLGGRIHDVAQDEADPGSPRVGVGARRVMEGQQVLFSLAEELGLALETPAPAVDLISARGGFAFAKDDLLPLYPGVAPAPGPNVDRESQLYDRLRFGPKRDHVEEYPDFRSYVRSAVGVEEYDFLRDMSRFRADFEAPLDARGYLDYLDEEWDVCCEAQYPVGGMSRFIVGMQREAEGAGARIFTSEPVSEIRRAGAGYELVTPGYLVRAEKVVIAVPPVALDWMTGDVVEDIRAQPEYQDLIGIKAVTITQWWPTSWWEGIVDPGLPSDNRIWRAWTTEHCLTFIEIPQEPYAAAQHVTRSVYSDDLDCVNFWEEASKDGIPALEAEIRRGLEYLFVSNGLTADAAIPDPLKTHVQIWPAAWHWLRAGAAVTNQQVYDWAVDPLGGEEVGLVGEAYNPQRSGWSDGAYKSSIHLLNTRYGLDL